MARTATKLWENMFQTILILRNPTNMFSFFRIRNVVVRYLQEVSEELDICVRQNQIANDILLWIHLLSAPPWRLFYDKVKGYHLDDIICIDETSIKSLQNVIFVIMKRVKDVS